MLDTQIHDRFRLRVGRGRDFVPPLLDADSETGEAWQWSISGDVAAPDDRVGRGFAAIGHVPAPADGCAAIHVDGAHVFLGTATDEVIGLAIRPAPAVWCGSIGPVWVVVSDRGPDAGEVDLRHANSPACTVRLRATAGSTSIEPPRRAGASSEPDSESWAPYPASPRAPRS